MVGIVQDEVSRVFDENAVCEQKNDVNNIFGKMETIDIHKKFNAKGDQNRRNNDTINSFKKMEKNENPTHEGQNNVPEGCAPNAGHAERCCV